MMLTLFVARAVAASLASTLPLAGQTAAQAQGLLDRDPVRRVQPVATQLAGNALGAYPHFEYVLAINELEPVSFALDPTRFPASAGATVDLYIVEARSRAEWQRHRTLVDIRGGPQTETLGVGSIQASTFVLTGSDALSADAGPGLGVPYDLVCDVNRNGVLDDADYIDGFDDEEAGFYVVHDLTQPGPLAITESLYYADPRSIMPGFHFGNLFYPTDIAARGPLPLIVVSGSWEWFYDYDHIAEHMAPYGYVVMVHMNNTYQKAEASAAATFQHTDAFLGNLETIEGGALAGHVDGSRIVWIGHSQGAEGVVIAYDHIVDGTWEPRHFRVEDIVLISSLAPTSLEGPADTHPHRVPYSLWTGPADDWFPECADSDAGQAFQLHDRAEGWRQSISVYGAGHYDFALGGAGIFDATGPCLLGRPVTHQIMRGYLLPLVKHYAENNVPARDFLWRQWESFRPIGAPTGNPCVTVNLMFREDPADCFVVDDYQSEPSTAVSSSGGSVSFDVDDLSEGRLDDANTTFTDDPGDPMNGMTLARPSDDSSGVVFGWDTDAFYQQAIVAAERDFSDDRYLTFRACQVTRHPSTTAEIGDLTFRVTLVDGSATTSSISIGAYGGGVLGGSGGGIEEPYQRTGCGVGAGWANEFETVRIRLTDFLGNGSGLDLSDIAAVRFDFGPSHGSAEGRIGLDDIMISRDPPQPKAGSLKIVLEQDLSLLAPGVSTDVHVRLVGWEDTLVPGTAQMHYRMSGGSFTTVALTPTGAPAEYTATLPAAGCTDEPELYFSAQGTRTGRQTLPADAPANLISPVVGVLTKTFADDFETDLGWTSENLGATLGNWERGFPAYDCYWIYGPEEDGDGSGQCYVTENQKGGWTDVNNGAVRLTSPTLDLSGELVRIDYLFWLNRWPYDENDRLLVEYNGNDGTGAWQTVVTYDMGSSPYWTPGRITTADILAAGATPSSTARLRFTANDADPQGIIEAGLDGFMVQKAVCE